MTDLHLVALLKQHGWKLHTRSTLRNWNKERLIDEIECLENNWGVSLEREEISFEYKKKLVEENEQLKQEKCELLGIIQQKDELIEKMKRCENCSKRTNCPRANRVRCRVYKTCDKWEMEE